MDKIIASFTSVADDDLRISEQNGVAYQADMTAGRVAYDDDYLRKCQAYQGSDIERKVLAGRCALVMRHLPLGANILDIGAGSGAFLRAAWSWGYAARGYDVIPSAADNLRATGLYADDPGQFEGVTLWDSIEHMDDPGQPLRAARAGALIFVSLPIFDDLRAIRASKHYRPGEHLYYWTAQGFIDWAALYGCRLLEQSSHETEAGRDSIGAFAFRKDIEK